MAIEKVRALLRIESHRTMRLPTFVVLCALGTTAIPFQVEAHPVSPSLISLGGQQTTADPTRHRESRLKRYRRRR